MGLDTSHDCWHGAYSAFMRWREMIAKAAELPPLELMEGFYEAGSYRDPIIFADRGLRVEGAFKNIAESLPIKWSCLKPDRYLYELLYHSDCDGDIPWESCGPMADRLEELLPELEKLGEAGGHIGNVGQKTRTFIEGLRLAASMEENVDFH